MALCGRDVLSDDLQILNTNAEPTRMIRHDSQSARRRLRMWLVSMALAAPALVPYVAQYCGTPAGQHPTPFIQYDTPYYLANAREHFDNGDFRLLYSNPFDWRYEAPAIYIQPMTLILGVLLRFTDISANILWIAFEVVAALACSRIALAFYTEIVGISDTARRLGLIVFFWGGGLLALAGILYAALTGEPVRRVVFRFDPFNGWWFLNFGRNLILPTEALYHALFFGCMLCLIRNRFIAAASVAFTLSASHPFTGVELLLILGCWSALELFFVRGSAVPRRFAIAIVGLLALHFGYYIGYLAYFGEHRKLMQAWSLSWLIQAENFLPAYALVGMLAIWSFRSLPIAREFFSRPRNRLFLVWFLVAFALENHEFAIKAIQPLHFTRGYAWTALFFMGAVPLVELFGVLLRLRNPVLRAMAVITVLVIMAFDNALWLARFPGAIVLSGQTQPEFIVTEFQMDLYRWFCRDENEGALVLPLTRDRRFGYLTSVYTPLRSWTGHKYNTPDLSERDRELAALLENGEMVSEWLERPLIVVIDTEMTAPDWLHANQFILCFRNDGYEAYLRKPTGDSRKHPDGR